jgi:PAS domain S-box-containing protein
MKTEKRAMKKRIATRFSVINAFFVVTILVITIAVCGSLISSLIDTVSADYVRFYTVDSIDKLNSQLSSEISLVRRVAQSPEVIAWFADEDNPEKKAAAYQVMMIYNDILQIDSLYFVIADSLNEYSIDYNTPYYEVAPFDYIDTDDLYDQWFFRAVSSPFSFDLNIDECKVSNTARLWINYKVTDDDGNVLGVFCSALQLDELVQDLYGEYDSRNVRKLIIDRRGIIRIDSAETNPHLITADNPMQEEEIHILSIYTNEEFVAILNRLRVSAVIFPENERAEPEVIKLTGGEFNYLAIAPIPGTSWLSVTFYNSGALFSVLDVFLPIFAVVFAFIVFVAANAVLIRQMVLSPLKRLIRSLSQANHDINSIYGVERDDELGAFAREMQDSWVRLGESSKHSKLMLDATPLSCTLWDENINIFDCNETVVELFGLKSKQEYTENFMKLFPEYQPCGRLSTDIMKESIEKVMQSESGRYVIEFMHILPNKELLPVEITLVKISDGSGAYFATYGRDLREYKRMMSEIEQRDRLLRVVNQVADTLLSSENSESGFESNLFNSMSMMATAVGANRAYIWKNHKLENGESGASQIYEWLEEGISPQGDEHAHNISYQAHMPDCRAILMKGEIINSLARDMSSVTYRFLSRTGVLSIVAVPIFLKDEFWGFVGFDNCRNEKIMNEYEAAIVKSGCLLIGNAFLRHETMQNLRLQTVTLTALFDSVPDIIFAKDSELHFTHANKAFLKHFGCDESIIGKTDAKGLGIPVELAERFNEMDRRIMRECRINIEEEYVPSVDGRVPFFETIKVPLMLDGESVGILGIARDITKRKEMEEAAHEASRSKSAFLANMSHEIRTPMNSIIGFSELALDDEVSPKAKDYLEKIIQNSEWLLQIINDILDISKIESGKMELEDIPFDLREVFGACKALIMPKAEAKGLTMHFYAEPSVGKVLHGDPTRLRQVLVNLLSNAVKFTNSGMVKVQAVVKDSDEDSVTMSFEVKDSGIGIPAEQMQKIFTPFIQAESGTTRQYGGSGLGLSITKNIIEMMGGTLIADSTVGVGSKFNFEIKFNAVNIEDETEPIRKESLEEVEKPTFEGEILLLEDNAMNQQVICEHLLRVGITTVVAKNGEIGVEIARNRKFDLIFMDIHMPVMDGIEATQKIREFDSEIPIVAMTANIMAGDTELYKASGMNDCVGKPFTSQELWRCLLKYLTPVENKQTVDIT